MSEKKQELLDALLESVKECQIRFGGKSELATEGENVIAKLCASSSKTRSFGSN